MKDEILIDLAESILSRTLGEGCWIAAEKDYTPPEGTLPGLKVGDKVFYYDEDELEIMECEVAVVHAGVGYRFWFSSSRGPVLFPIYDDSGRTLKEIVELRRQDIMSDFEYHQERADAAKKILDSSMDTKSSES